MLHSVEARPTAAETALPTARRPQKILRRLSPSPSFPFFSSSPLAFEMFSGGSGFSNGEFRHRGRRGMRGYGGEKANGGWFGVSRVYSSSSSSSSCSNWYAPRLEGDHGSAPAVATSPQWAEFDRAYFQSYSHVGIHEEMIKDHVRTDTYRAAIMRHQNLIEGKVVMDVGCGTGILSIFCAQAGARRVYAVEASAIAAQANEIVEENNLSDKIIVLHGRIEDVNVDEKVDVIISEWMGYMLLYESMLPSIIFARDKWLKHGGLILPSHATLYMAPVTNFEKYSESIDFWSNVYGIDMSALLPLAKQCAFEEPVVETISGENVLTWPFVVKSVDAYTVTARELESITRNYRFASMMLAPLHGFAFWFDVEFNGLARLPSDNHLQLHPGNSCSDLHFHGSSPRKKRVKSDDVIVLSTAPENAPTHWQQTLLYFYDPIELKQDQIIEGSVTISQSKENPRFLNIHLEYSSGGRSFVKESVLR